MCAHDPRGRSLQQHFGSGVDGRQAQLRIQGDDAGADVVQNVGFLLHACPMIDRLSAVRLLAKQE